ncbi:MAG: double-strand break repair protein AddB [Ahrensia sp.]
MKTHLPRVFSIPPGTPFLETVAHSLCAGQLIDGFRFDGNPLVLADATIYVPTRRAARELRSAFLDEVGRSSVLLPTIRPLGEFDDDLDFFSDDADASLSIPPAIDTIQRQVLLGKLIIAWTKHVGDNLRRLYEDEDITTPVTIADAFWLAADLAAVIDQMHAEGKTIEDLRAATDQNESDWWGITLAFLEIVKSEWPAILAQNNRIDPADHRNRMIEAEIRRLKNTASNKPIIVAGSTGSIPATARLIAAIANLPHGAVVLPGYEVDMGAALKSQFDSFSKEPSVVGHPQFGMRKLVRQIGIDNASVETLNRTGANGARTQWVSQALLPPALTGGWQTGHKALGNQAFDGVALLEAANDSALATAIAAAMRETIHHCDKRTALVTPDRNLARRVSIELARYGIEADDSGGLPFSNTSQGQLLALLFRVVFEPGDPAMVLALLKHEAVCVGFTQNAYRDVVTAFEHIALRSGRGRFDPADIVAFFERQTQRQLDQTREPAWMKRFDADSIDAARNFAAVLQSALAPLVAVRAQKKASPSEAVATTIQTLEALCADEHGRHEALYGGAAGETLETMLTRLIETSDDLRFEPDQWPRIMDAISASASIKPSVSGHPRVFIWGTLEARLQQVDQLILGGLNEGTWPQTVNNDAFLTRLQKNAMGMEPPERRIGLSAHDFQMAMGQGDLVLARTLRSDGAPTVASRWWQRLTTLAGKQATELMKARGQRLLSLGAQANEAKWQKPAPRPAPKPPLSMRPRSLSVTQVETLKNDPYAIFAKKILKLTPVDPMIRDPDASDRGQLFHAILEMALTEGIDFAAADAADKLRAVGERCFKDEGLPPEIFAFWWPRFEALIEPLIAWERERGKTVVERHAELSVRPTPVDDTGVSLTGRADRIDLRIDGLLDIIDYKTGTTPATKAVEKLQEAQLTLEAALAQRGAFTEVGPRDTHRLTYLKLGSRGEVEAKPDIALSQDADLAGKAWANLVTLLDRFNDEDHPYLSQARPKKSNYAGDYDHLARVLEWSAGDSDADDGAGGFDG